MFIRKLRVSLSLGDNNFILGGTTSVNNKTKYGNRRWLRMRKIMVEWYVIDRNDAVGVITNHCQELIKKMDRIMRFDSNFITQHVSV